MMRSCPAWRIGRAARHRGTSGARLRLDRFTTMNTFVEVVKNASFTTAARSRGISRALVSRQIADLETHLGARLLTRTTRSLKLTEAGREYYEFCSRILSEIGAA